MDPTRLTPVERDRLLYEVHQALFGISHNPDENGLVGDVKDMKGHLVKLNGQVKTNTIFRKAGTFLTGAIVIALITIAANILSA